MTLLAIEGLSKSFGGVRAVNDISFSLQSGEWLAMIGPNGAGKSTCFNLLNGQLAPDAGRVRLEDRDITGTLPRKAARLGVARTFQVAATYPSMTVLENVQMGILARERKHGSFGRSAARHGREEALDLLGQVGMQEQAERACAVLAYGDVKRLELAIALAGRPKLLLMDEPTAGMASGERHALMRLTQRLVRERNLGVLFTEHSMDVVFAFAQRIIVLARGRLIAQGSGDDIRNDPNVREAYFGAGALAGLGGPGPARS